MQPAEVQIVYNPATRSAANLQGIPFQQQYGSAEHVEPLWAAGA